MVLKVLKKLAIIIRRLAKATTNSRTSFGKLLSKFPSDLFPNYRCLVNRVIVSNNRRRTIAKETLPSDTDEDSEETCQYRCCKYCYHHYYKEIKTDCPKSDHELIDDHHVTSSTPNIPEPPPFPEHLLTIDKEKDSTKKPAAVDVCENNFKITLDDITQVRLRKSTYAPKKVVPKTPDKNDIYCILMKRYAVMHTPTPKRFNDTFDSDENDNPPARFKVEKRVLLF